ncbi:hypothetical protein [Desulfohalobium retbaense]|uniref:Uncharacterized protein n=1 Tax=Desulfohalobium retbaense (strain ATCC 49708 / DSM 5692 / JCM 16813 / HR100) TaxID=485915 RepID=C8X1Y1_DESRD|nr:hypothetical protein [Desulfohalobium retbaense]ACV68553.1 hypothetical protein Dret_1265 [Desulfohalobium retbaense DSM 5692]
MQPTPFDPEYDYPPLPFTEAICRLARELKRAGLPWHAHVGCFVWDPDRALPVESPFPHRIYFILNLGHFVKLLGDVDTLERSLVWLPTWYQIRTLAQERGVPVPQEHSNPETDLRDLYKAVLTHLQS